MTTDRSVPVNLRVGPRTAELLETLSGRYGASRAAVVEMAVEMLAAQEGMSRAGTSTGYGGGGEALLDEVREEISREAGESDRGEG